MDAPQTPTNTTTRTPRLIADWLLRCAPIRDVRVQLAANGEDQSQARQQLALTVEAARRLTDPADALPEGSHPVLLLSLYRDAVYWGLVSLRPRNGSPPADLATLWREAAQEILVRAARDPDNLRVVKDALLERSQMGCLLATWEDVVRVRAFSEALLHEVSSPIREMHRLLLQRWKRIAAVGAMLLLAGWGVRSLLLGPDLVADRPFQTSSTFPGCAGAPECVGLMFHTNVQDNPWVEFDLGAPKKVHRVEVENRADECCRERAVPLLAETSVDHVHWTQVARHDPSFATWIETFPTQVARYVRLRVPRATALHLKSVAVR